MRRTRITIAAVLIGVGLGALLEGIVFHLDIAGWFHGLAWAVTLAGIFGLWSAFRAPGRTPSTKGFAGSLLLGWGGFNLVEGLLNHFLLKAHEVRDLPIPDPTYDWMFLAAGGVGIVLIGLALRDLPDPGPVLDRRSGADRRTEPRFI